MPGKKHMNQDRPVDGQDTLQTMQDKKSGIYQDRVDGKLPQSRVAQHYQAMDAKMEQTGNDGVSAATMKAELKGAGNFVADNTYRPVIDAIKNSSVGKAVGATYDYLSGQKEEEANEFQNKYNAKRKEIMGGKK